MLLLQRKIYIFGFLFGLVLLLLVGGLAHAHTITITACFQYEGPDGQVHPCRWGWCELRDYDPIRDDVIQEGYTDENGQVVFSYDSNMDDGWGGGRIDPYVRCYTRLCLPSDPAHGRYYYTNICVGYVIKKRRFSVTQLQRAYYELNTRRWDNNNSDLYKIVTASGDEGHAFFIMDCIAAANCRSNMLSGTAYEPQSYNKFHR